MWSEVDTADFPVIHHVSDTKDTEYHPKLVKFFDGEFLIGAMYCMF